MSKSVEDVIAIIDKMAPNDHQVQHNIGPSQMKVGIIKLGTNDVILDQNK